MKNFAQDLERAINANGMNITEFAKMVGVSANGATRWVKGEAMPKPARWKAIKQATGIDCQEYKIYDVAMHHSPQSQANISAESGATVSISNQTGNTGRLMVELSEEEHSALILFRRFGNQEMLQRCLRQLRAVEAITA
jgi:DNA-binding transcriptional regulator YdaS (Cro superfamily)